MKTSRLVLAALILVISVLLFAIRREDKTAASLEEVSPVVNPVKPEDHTARPELRTNRELGKNTASATNATKHKFQQWTELNEQAKTNAAYQAWARDYMVNAMSKIVSNVPIYGLMTPLNTNGVNVYANMWGEDHDPQFTLETENFTRALLDHGAVRKVEVLTQILDGTFDSRLTREQQAEARATLDWAYDKNWSDAEILAAFKATARQFEISEADLDRTPGKPQREPVDKKKVIQPANAQKIPPQKFGGGNDATMTVDLKESDSSSSTLFSVTFRTEKLADGSYRLAVVKLVNQNWANRDPGLAAKKW